MKFFEHAISLAGGLPAESVKRVAENLFMGSLALTYS